ncbi:MAG: hypothetical protein IPL61_00385 [Myxococcales bacterium]|nr:hypothetical protein [Myxococcales bacterium]
MVSSIQPRVDRHVRDVFSGVAAPLSKNPRGPGSRGRPGDVVDVDEAAAAAPADREQPGVRAGPITGLARRRPPRRISLAALAALASVAVAAGPARLGRSPAALAATDLAGRDAAPAATDFAPARPVGDEPAPPAMVFDV